MITLPRQARDKCRESTRKRERCVFLQAEKPSRTRGLRRRQVLPRVRQPARAAGEPPQLQGRSAGLLLRRLQRGAERRTPFFEEEPFSDLETIINLPRQARDKHSERLRKNLYICRRIRPIAARKTAATGISARRALAALLGVGST